MNRRAFCSLAAAASSAPLHSTYKKIRVAVLGTGHAHALGKIQALRTLPEYELAGICSRVPNVSSGQIPIFVIAGDIASNAVTIWVQ